MHARRAIAVAIPALLACAATDAVPARAAEPSARRAIRTVDFRNFAYRDGSDTYTARNGTFDSGDTHFQVRDVHYGDISGDGVEEAVVTTNVNTGGTGQFSDGWVFRWSGKPVLVGTLGIGDRADGGVLRQRIIGGKLVDERYGQDNSGACCPEYIVSRAATLRGTKLVFGPDTKRGAFFVESEVEFQKTAQPELKFLRGTTSSYVEMDARSANVFTFEARKGQFVNIRDISGDATVHAFDGDAKLLSVAAGGERRVVLPRDGFYTVTATPRRSGSDPLFISFDIAIA